MKQFVMDGWVTNAKVDTRTTATGRTVTSFSVSTSPTNRRGQDGEWESVPQFFQVKYSGESDRDRRPDAIVPGAKLVMAGKPTFEEWRQDGQEAQPRGVRCGGAVAGRGPSAARARRRARLRRRHPVLGAPMDARGYEEGADRAARLLAKSWMLARRGEDGEGAAAHDGAGDALRAI